MYLLAIVFFIKSIGYFGIFLVISANLHLLWYCIISTVSPHFASADMFYSLDIIMFKIQIFKPLFYIKIHIYSYVEFFRLHVLLKI